MNRRGRRVALGVLTIIAALLWLAAWLQAGLRQQARETLHAIQASTLAAVELWLQQQLDAVTELAAQSSIAAAAPELLRGDRRSLSVSEIPLANDFELPSLPSLQHESVLGWLLTDIEGRVVAAGWPDLVGQELPMTHEVRQRLSSRRAAILKPFPLPIALAEELPQYRQPGGAVLAAMAPIGDGPAVTGAVAILVDPLAELGRLLAGGRLGSSGETYLLDRYGVLLSPSRFEPATATAPSAAMPQVFARRSATRAPRPLHTEMRDPHGALTVLADQLTRQGRGEDLLGYPGYGGTAVIGVWQWMPEFGMGIATEIAAEEIYRPAYQLRRATLALAALCLAAVLARLYWRRRSRLDPAEALPRPMGRYQLVDLISTGGMGDVYRGRQLSLGRDVAIKVLRADQGNGPQASARFEREVRLTARLRHPNTIDVYDFGRTADGALYYVMELVDGISLQELVERDGRQPPARVIQWLLQVCGSLSEAHQLGMIHRDIKPSNLLLATGSGLQDVVKVLDFGLVKQLDVDCPAGTEPSDLTDIDGITGTPMYMSPEAVRDAATADPRSDLYAVGAVGYFLLTGQPLFQGEHSVDVCLNQLHDQPLRPSDRIRQPLPEDLENLLMSCLQKSPEQRPQSAAALADSLRCCRDAGGWPSTAVARERRAGAN